MITDNPRDTNVPHDTWRTGQKQTVEWLHDETQPNVRIIESSTGSGKSATAKSLTDKYNTLVITHTRNLQQAYHDVYGAEILFGKSNYPCIHPEANRNATADECLYKGEKSGMRGCPFSDSCPYWNAKLRAMSPDSRIACLNYALWLADHKRWPAPEALVLDEAHLLPDITLEHCGTQINQRDVMEWGLPDFPELDSTSGGILIKAETPVPYAADWLEDCIAILEKKYDILSRRENQGNPKLMQQARKCDHLKRRLEAVVEALDNIEDGWYIKSGHGVIEYRGQYEPGFVCKPLTPKLHFPRFFLQPRILTVLMSATIGKPDSLAKVLNIPEFSFRIVPNQFQPEARPIYVAEDAPHMNYKSTEVEYTKQAEIIARMLNDKERCNPKWAGIVHVTRKSESVILAQRLAKLGFQDRVYVQDDNLGTNQRVDQWHQYLRYHRNAILITHALHDGYDGLTEKINIVAKTPWPVRGTPGSYDEARMNADMEMYRLSTAWDLTQAWGRTRRGRDEDYDIPGEPRGFVSIVDNSFRRIKSYLPNDVLDALVSY